MAVLWETGFEPRDPEPGYHIPDGDIVEIVTAPVISGTQSLRLYKASPLPPYTGPMATLGPGMPATGIFAIRFKFMFQTLPPEGNHVTILDILSRDPTYALVARIYLTATSLTFRRYVGGAVSTVIPISIGPNEPHMIEVDYAQDVAGGYKLYFDGVLLFDSGVIDTSAQNATHAYMGIRDTHYNAEVFLDDIEFGDAYLGEVTYTLSVNTTPISDVPFTISGVGIMPETPWSGVLEQGTYTITMPYEVQIGDELHRFAQWEDGSTDPTRTINLFTDATLTATYEYVGPAPPTPPRFNLGGAVLLGSLAYIVTRNPALSLGTSVIGGFIFRKRL